MKKLEETDIIRIMREEWNAKVAALSETVDAVMKGKVDGEEKTLIGTDLKLRHKKTQFLYTVMSVGPRDVILKTPEGKQFLVNKEDLEKNYEID
jgi:hypothetical protein